MNTFAGLLSTLIALIHTTTAQVRQTILRDWNDSNACSHKGTTMIATGFRRIALAALAFAFAAAVTPSPAQAVPTLQLNIEGGTYDAFSQTIRATSNSFTLYALLVPDSAARLSHTYYVAAALVPKTGPAPATLGSFSVASNSVFSLNESTQNVTAKTIQVTQDMVYGVPPLEADQDHDAHDLGQHGIYQTYFAELEFKFQGSGVTTQRADVYNSQTNAGIAPTNNPNGGMYYRAFTVDTSNLAAGYAIHFDLYNEQQRNNGDIDVKAFAPFSHDAQSMLSTGPTSSVPVPASVVLVILGLAITVALRHGIQIPGFARA